MKAKTVGELIEILQGLNSEAPLDDLVLVEEIDGKVFVETLFQACGF
jgi:hypothetical protein